MKHQLASLAILSAALLASPAFAAQEAAETKSTVEFKDNGGYESTKSSGEKLLDGTIRKTDSKVDVSVDSDGKVDKTVKTETVTDPAGLMNKKADTATTDIEEKERGGYKETTTNRHTDRVGTETTTKTVTDVDVDAAGNVTEKVKVKKTVDPKGLMNKKSSTVETKTENGKVIESEKTGN